jgi:hypothetical protein
MSPERRLEAPVKEGAPIRTLLRVISLEPPDAQGRIFAILHDVFLDRYRDIVGTDVHERDIVRFKPDHRYTVRPPKNYSLPEGPLTLRSFPTEQQMQQSTDRYIDDYSS